MEAASKIAIKDTSSSRLRGPPVRGTNGLPRPRAVRSTPPRYVAHVSFKTPETAHHGWHQRHGVLPPAVSGRLVSVEFRALVHAVLVQLAAARLDRVEHHPVEHRGVLGVAHDEVEP